MILINCPWCGPRGHTEFTYYGDASRVRPNFETTSDKELMDYIYIRSNPKGLHDEFWHHTSGCRKYVKVRRDVVTHEIHDTSIPGVDFIGEEK